MPRKTSTTKLSSTIHGESNPITVDIAKKLLGWEVVEKGHHFKDVNGDKIACTSNLSNRPLYRSNYSTLKQEILRRKWRLNGEPIIIGDKFGILNGQHTLIALVLASQEIEQNPELWEDYWTEEPTVEKVIVFGIPEEDSIINTLDTCKPRTLMDVIYRSSYFQKVPATKRKKVARSTDYAVRLMWHRTGASLDAFTAKRTHAESLDFIERHPTLLECVSFIQEEDGEEKTISNYLTVGYASALMYLMATSSTDRNTYYSSPEGRVEESINLELMEQAQEFFVHLGSAESFNPVRKALGKLVVEGLSSLNTKCSVLIKAWECYVSGDKITTKKLELKFIENQHGVLELADIPVCGGIDLGNPEEEPSVVKKDSIQARAKAEQVKSKKRKVAEDKTPKSKVKSKAKGIQVGDKVWVCEGIDSESDWPGEVTEITGALEKKMAKVKVGTGFAGAGNEIKVKYSDLKSKNE